MVLIIFIFIFIVFNFSVFYYSLVYLIITACEGALGLSILVILSRSIGGDYFKTFNILINYDKIYFCSFIFFFYVIKVGVFFLNSKRSIIDFRFVTFFL